MNLFTSGLPPKKIKVLRPDMKYRKRTPIFLRKHDLRRRNLHPVSVFFIFFDVNPGGRADVNLVRKHSYRADIFVAITDGQTDGQTDGRTDKKGVGNRAKKKEE